MEEILSPRTGSSTGIPHGEVINSLCRVYRQKTSSGISRGLLLTISTLLITATLSSLCEIVFDFGIVGKVFLSFTTILSLFACIRYLAPDLIKYFKSPGTEDIRDIALEAGNRFPELKDRLRNAVELLSSERNRFYSAELAAAYIDKIFEQASHLNIASALRYRIDRRTKAIFSISFFFAFVIFLLFPSQMPNALARIVNLSENTPSAYSIKVSPGDVQLSRGDTLKVEANVGLITARKLPSYIVVSEKYDNEREFEKHNVKQSTDGKSHFQLPNVRSDMTYFISADEQNTQEYHVKVVDLPLVQSFTITLVYPAYTGKTPETLQDNIGDFTALVGARAEITLRANKDLRSARIDFGDSTEPDAHVPMAQNKNLVVSGTNASGAFIVTRTLSYSLHLLDTDSLQNRDPILYTAQAVDDEYPTCEITYPGKDVDLSRDMQLPLRIRVGDDYGFTKLLLEYKLVNSKYIQPEKNYHSIEIPLETKSAGAQEIAYTWDLTSMDLVPEDVISYHAKVFDNDMVHGPKATASAEFQVRLPSLDEVFASTDSEHSDLTSETENALGNSTDLKQQLDKLSQDMKTMTQQMSWEQQKKMQNTLQKYEELQQRIDSVRNQVESMTRKMLENKIISPQTLEKYLELQRALQEINSPEFQDALKKLQQAIQSLSPDQVRQAMKNFQVNEEQLRQSIERTLSLIKRVEIEQKFDELQKRIEQMLSQQEGVQKSAVRSDSTNAANEQQLADKQKEIESELSGTKDALSDLQRRMQEFAKEMPTRKVNEANQKLQRSGAEQNMQKSANQLSQGQFSQAMTTQQQIESSLEDFQKTLSEAHKEMLQNQQREIVNAMQKAQQNLLEISKKQEDLRDQSVQTMPNSAENRTLADKQNELMQELNFTAQQMMQLSNKSFAVTPQMGRQIGEAYSQMQQAMNELQSRTGQPNVAEPQTQAMGAMNQAVMSIQSMLQAMMQGQGSGGFPSLMQQLQQLAGQQEGVNALTQKLGEGGALSMEQQAELARVAAQQEVIRKSLSQLAQEAQQSEAMNQQNKVLGDLGQIANDMKDVVHDLQSNDIKPETIQRQQRILSRMLDASRSINQRDYDNRRKSAPGQDVIRQSPDELNLSIESDRQNQELLRLIRKNFSPEYQKIILRYYRIINRVPE
jgi:hypothetical protein